MFSPVLDDCVGCLVVRVIVWCCNTRFNEKLCVVDCRLGFNLHVNHIPKLILRRICEHVYFCVVVCCCEESEAVG